MQSAESRIRDTDMADEMTRFSKESILQQAATSMRAQAEEHDTEKPNLPETCFDVF